MVLLYEPGAVPILVSLYHGMELVSGTPPLWRPILVSPALGTELVSGWIPLFTFPYHVRGLAPWEKMSVVLQI